MGNWLSQEDPTSTTAQEDIAKERWLCCAPGTKNYPVSGCIMTWNNQLSLTLKLHSSVAKDNHSSIETLCTWGEELLEDVKISPEAYCLIQLQCLEGFFSAELHTLT